VARIAWYQNPKYVAGLDNVFRRESAVSFSMDSSEMDEGVTRSTRNPRRDPAVASHLYIRFHVDEFPGNDDLFYGCF
jgi:hypothetical protein